MYKNKGTLLRIKIWCQKIKNYGVWLELSELFYIPRDVYVLSPHMHFQACTKFSIVVFIFKLK